MENEKKNGTSALKALFIFVGAVVTIGAVLVVLYSLFKKYFKITFECNSEDCDCFEDDCDCCEPLCYTSDDAIVDEVDAE